MADLTVSTDIDAFMGSADNAAARTSLELGATDTVEFQELTTSQFNFPNLTTAELDAVTDATAGDTYFDSDRGQFVRFTGAASYDVITSRAYTTEDTSTASAGVTLDVSRFFESGLILATDVFLPKYQFTVFDTDDVSDPSGTTYIYSDAAVVPAGWYDLADVFGLQITAAVVVPNKQYRIDRDDGVTATKTQFSFRRFLISDVTEANVTTQNLQGGSTYSVEVTLSAGDLATGNLRFNVDYTGLYTKARALITCDNLLTGTKVGSMNIPVVESDFYTFSSITRVAMDSPLLGLYTFKFLLSPSSDGIFTLAARQAVSDADGIMLGEAQVVTTLMVD